VDRQGEYDDEDRDERRRRRRRAERKPTGVPPPIDLDDPPPHPSTLLEIAPDDLEKWLSEYMSARSAR